MLSVNQIHCGSGLWVGRGGKGCLPVGQKVKSEARMTAGGAAGREQGIPGNRRAKAGRCETQCYIWLYGWATEQEDDLHFSPTPTLAWFTRLIVPTLLCPPSEGSWDMDKKGACLSWLCWSPAAEVWLPWRWAPWKLIGGLFQDGPGPRPTCRGFASPGFSVLGITLGLISPPLHFGKGNKSQVVILACRI